MTITEMKERYLQLCLSQTLTPAEKKELEKLKKLIEKL